MKTSKPMKISFPRLVSFSLVLLRCIIQFSNFFFKVKKNIGLNPIEFSNVSR
jgi:hypothetical protein